MKIAQVAPLMESVPPRLYGGTERVVSYLTEELVRQGHDVTLFASGDSKTAARLAAGVPKALRLEAITDAAPYHLMLLDQVCRCAAEFDILHFHIDLLHYPLIRDFAGRTVTTLHGRLDLSDLYAFYRHFRSAPRVSISNAQRRPMPAVKWVGSVPNGLPRELLSLGPGGRYLAFLGRISPEKRPDRAIEIAARSGRELRIAAKIDPVDRDYWRSEIQPLLARHPNVTYLGEISDCEKSAFLGHAAALLFPIDWPEPFRLAMIEAMACGTPVVGWDIGSVPEVIDEGVTGFIANSIAEAVAAVARIDGLDRTRIRSTFERRFTASRMAREYVNIYRRLQKAQQIARLPTMLLELNGRATAGSQMVPWAGRRIRTVGRRLTHRRFLVRVPTAVGQSPPAAPPGAPGVGSRKAKPARTEFHIRRLRTMLAQLIVQKGATSYATAILHDQDSVQINCAMRARRTPTSCT